VPQCVLSDAVHLLATYCLLPCALTREQDTGSSTRGAGSRVCAVGGDVTVHSLRARFEGQGKQAAVPPALAHNRTSINASNASNNSKAMAVRAWDKDNASKGHERRNSGRRSSTVQPKAQVRVLLPQFVHAQCGQWRV
jgi:hypothetical protein